MDTIGMGNYIYRGTCLWTLVYHISRAAFTQLVLICVEANVSH